MRLRERGGAAALLLLAAFAGCASAPPPRLRLKVDGQIVGSSIRELIVTTFNDGTRAEDVAVQIEVPANLLLPNAQVTGSMTQSGRTSGAAGEAVLRFDERRVAPNGRSVVRLPLRNGVGSAVIAAWSPRRPESRIVERRPIILTR